MIDEKRLNEISLNDLTFTGYLKNGEDEEIIRLARLGLQCERVGLAENGTRQATEGEKMRAKREQKHCPKCSAKLVKKPNMFFLREAGHMPGMVCEPCNALYESNEWLAALDARIANSTNSSVTNFETDK